MKTTIDIPEPIYKRAKVAAIERGQTLRQVLLDALDRELNAAPHTASAPPTFSDRRRLVRTYAVLEEKGAYRAKSRKTDMTALISEDRDAR